MGYNEYFEYEVTVENLSKEERKWFESVIDDEVVLDITLLNEDLEYDDPEDEPISKRADFLMREYINRAKEFFTPDDAGYPDFVFEYSKKNTVIEFSPGENGLMDGINQVVKILHAFVKKFRPNEKIGFHWVRWDNRCQGTYDGGAFVISSKGIDSFSLKQWLDTYLKM